MLTVQQLSQELGITPDTIRVWEKRYGNPVPQRNRRGHRRYSQQQLEELRLVRNLQMLGKKPKEIFSLTPEQRFELLTAIQKRSFSGEEGLLSLVCFGSAADVEAYLSKWAAKGCADFIFHGLLPLLSALENGWIVGNVTISREHLISDVVMNQLKLFLEDEKPTRQQPHCAFVTLNGERHRLGLMMAACLFNLQGIYCSVVSDDVPTTEVPRICQELKTQAVALSFSGNYQRHKAFDDIVALRTLLPDDVQIIVGGKAVEDMSLPPGVTLCGDLRQVDTIAANLVLKK
nr:MerR family transcriptional regulator [uncultured Desulfuromonas sp.]